MGNIKDSNWHSVVRDLSEDLKVLEPDNNITEIKYFMFRGSGHFSDIKVLDNQAVKVSLNKGGDGNGTIYNDIGLLNCGLMCSGYYNSGRMVFNAEGDSTSKFIGWEGDCSGEETQCIVDFNEDVFIKALFEFNGVYEDSEDESIIGWDVYDKTPEGATITNVYDEEKDSRVIKLDGDATKNGFRLRKDDLSSWKNTSDSIIKWEMKYDESYTVYIDVLTSVGKNICIIQAQILIN